MNREPKQLHFDATMPTDDGPVAVSVNLFVCEDEGGRFCQIEIKKKHNAQKLWADITPEQAKLLAKRLKAVAKWSKASQN